MYISDHIHGEDSPILLAADVFNREPSRYTFHQVLDLHKLTGEVIISNIDGYCMAWRPVDKEADPRLIVDPAHPFPRIRWNCYHIYLASGDIFPHLIKYATHGFEWVSWERRNRLRFYEISRIKSKLHTEDSAATLI